MTGQNAGIGRAATNLATAEMLIMGLQRGDLDWRDIVNPKTKPFTT